MNTPLTIIPYWYQNDWGMAGRRHEMMARALSNHPTVERVLHLELPVPLHRLPKLLRAARRSAAHRDQLRRLFTTLHPAERLFLRTPWRPGVHHGERHTLIRAVESPLVRAQFRWFRHQLIGDRRPRICWLYPPVAYWRELLDVMRPDLIITDVVDDAAAAPHLSPAEREHVRRQTVAQLRAADIAFAVSDALCERYRSVQPAIQRLPNAVDQERFVDSTYLPPLDMADIPAPRVGYVGTLQHRIDGDLLRRVAVTRPQYHFVFIGIVHPQFRRGPMKQLRHLPNTHFLGEKPWSDVPRYLAAFDACIIPHTQDDLTKSMDPLKLYEYLAAGKPVVATPVAGTPDFADLLYLADAADSFARALDAALAEDNPERQAARWAAIQPHTWTNLVAHVLDDHVLPVLAGHL